MKEIVTTADCYQCCAACRHTSTLVASSVAEHIQEVMMMSKCERLGVVHCPSIRDCVVHCPSVRDLGWSIVQVLETVLSIVQV